MTGAIHIIKKGDAKYPSLLARIADPPEQLYCRGNVDLLETFCIGVVGTRNASDYGRQACRDIVSHVAASGVTIVSGLALGIDVVAHQTALDAPGATIAVLGTGIENLYPKENEQIARRIIAEGSLIVSEFAGMKPGAKHTFPMRNRIISGLSRGVLVVEADKKSGSLITAKCALDQDRDVFAVPGSIYWPRSIGTNWLIGEGAKPVQNGAEILTSYQLRQIPLPINTATVSTQDPVQQKILAILEDSGPTHIDRIVVQSAFETPRVMGAIALLELFGHIKHQGAGIYICN